MIAGRRWLAAAAISAAVLMAGAAAAGAQNAGGGAGGGVGMLGLLGSQSGFSAENVISELSEFLPEGTWTLSLGRGGGQGQAGQGQAGQTGTQQRQGTNAQGGNNRFATAMSSFPVFKRDAKLYLTAKQVDALMPVLQDLQASPYPTPGKAKQHQATLDGTLSKQQKDAWAAYVKERDKAVEQLRKQFASQQGAAAGGAAAGGQAGQGGQRVQRDPAEIRKQMLTSFIDALTKYRKGLQ